MEVYLLHTKIKNSFLNNMEFNYLGGVCINEFYLLKVTIEIYKPKFTHNFSNQIDYNSYS